MRCSYYVDYAGASARRRVITPIALRARHARRALRGALPPARYMLFIAMMARRAPEKRGRCALQGALMPRGGVVRFHPPIFRYA